MVLTAGGSTERAERLGPLGERNVITTPFILAAQLALVALPALGPGDDAAPLVAGPRFEAESLFASERPGTTRVVVQLGAPAETMTRVPFAVGGSATLGEDYLISDSPLVIPPGQSTGTILVDVLRDFVDEGQETLEITLGTGGTANPDLRVGHEGREPPELTAPPHKDFWEVWANKFTFKDFEDDTYLREMASIPGAYDVRDGVHYERLIVFEATLP